MQQVQYLLDAATILDTRNVDLRATILDTRNVDLRATIFDPQALRRYFDQTAHGSTWQYVEQLWLEEGVGALTVELVADESQSGRYLSARISIAAIITNIIWFFSKKELFQTQSKDWLTLIFSGVFATAAPFIALSWGQQYVTSAFAGISMASVVDL